MQCKDLKVPLKAQVPRRKGQLLPSTSPSCGQWPGEALKAGISGNRCGLELDKLSTVPGRP